MGEYFKDEKARTGKPKEEIISNFDTLCAAYNELVIKIRETTEQGYEAILPIRNELTGGKTTPDDIGQIGNLRRKIETSRISRMSIGSMMWDALKNIEDLDRWSERYITYIEEHMDGLQLISKSSFKIISNLHEEIRILNLKVRQLEDQIVAQTGALPITKRPVIKEEKLPSIPKKVVIDEEFKNLVQLRLKKYLEAVKTDDKDEINSAKEKVFDVCKDEKDKKPFVEREFKKILNNV